ESTESTNADVLAAAHRGAPEGTIHITELQSAAKGRLGRVWQAPPSSSIVVSMLVRARQIPFDQWSSLSLLAGLAVHATLRDIGLSPTLKWPNDVLIDSRKICGIMIDIAHTDLGYAAVVGIGLNATLRSE